MAKQQSLAAQAGALAAQGGIQLPSIFKPPAEPIRPRYVAPYITFAHPKRADEWARLNAAYSGVAEGDMFLVESEEVTLLNPAKLSLLAYTQYWVEANAAGEVLRVSFKEAARPFKEQVDAVVLVYLEGRALPANVQFRTTKCSAPRALSQALQEAQQPSWADKSPAHAETMNAQLQLQPWGRFYGEVSLGATRTSKTTGMAYRPAQCSIRPTGLPEWRLLSELAKDPAAAEKAFKDAAAYYEGRVAEAKQKAK